MKWMLLPYRRYFEFYGRSRRLEYWMFSLFSFILCAVFFTLIWLGGGAQWLMNPTTDLNFAGMSTLFTLGVAGLAIWAVASFIPSLAVTVRRLHDRNLPGWLYAVVVVLQLIPVVGMAAALALLVVNALPGTVGPNKYGADPKKAPDLFNDHAATAFI